MLIILVTFSMAVIGQLNTQEYSDTQAIFRELVNTTNYTSEVIPVANQSDAIDVFVEFSLVSIVSVDDTTESFVCNGFLTLVWRDEIIRWEASDYGGQEIIHPLPRQIWRPRVILLNTLEDRDPFADDVSPVIMLRTGDTSWVPGALFRTSCALNLLKYPFDEQTCSIQMLSMGLTASEVVFRAGFNNLDFYSISGEWDLKNTSVVIVQRTTGGIILSGFDINIQIKRRPTFFVLNIILPFVFLSFLNLLVFMIPQESGEKIGYGITVLLALSVFFSIIGGMLPRSSETVPYVIIYLFILYVLSTLAVIDSIVIGFIYHMEERAEHHKKMRNKFKNLFGKVSTTRNIVDMMQTKAKGDQDENGVANEEIQKREKLASGLMKRLTSKDKMGPQAEKKESGVSDMANALRHKLAASFLDFISCLIFILIWLSVTMWYFISVTS